MEITKGKCVVEKRPTEFEVTVYCGKKRICEVKSYRVGFNDPTTKEADANAELIREAFNTYNETGFSPRQLADRNKKLLEAVKEAIRHVVESCTRLGLDHTKHSTWQKCNKLIKSTKI